MHGCWLPGLQCLLAAPQPCWQHLPQAPALISTQVSAIRAAVQDLAEQQGQAAFFSGKD